MAIPKLLKILPAILLFISSLASAQVMHRTSCAVPLDEKKSAPSIDLLTAEGTPVDQGILIDEILARKDTSNLQPQLSDFYVGKTLPLVEYNVEFPSDQSVVSKPLQYVSDVAVDHLTRVRVVDPENSNNAYTLVITYDVNAAVARNALLRKLGYNIPSPRLYKKLAVKFDTLENRDALLNTIARGRDLGLWVDGGTTEIDKKNLTITFINVTLESALIVNIPPMHWGIFPTETLQSRRPFRSLLVPLTLLDIDESVNMYAFEPAKIENNHLIFSRVFASTFLNETSLGDVKWIAKKIAALSEQDWADIIHTQQYPEDIEALVLEKTIARTNQLMALLQIKDFKPLDYDVYVSKGSVINGKAYQAKYPGFPHFFAYGDPKNPLRLSEMIRFFGIEIISNGIKFALDTASKYLQIWSPDKYIKEHSKKFYEDIIAHTQANPDAPYVAPLSAWGGPIAGGGVSANRSVVAGTYYGGTNPVQMVDSITVNARIGAFVGISGLKSIGLSVSPTLAYTRSYVHVRPIDDIKTALKDNWTHLAVPFSMLKLSNVLLKKDGEDDSKTIEGFLNEMKTGEMFIVVDGFTLSNNTMVGIPVGAMLGLMPPFTNVSETINGTNQYAITSRTTIYKSDKGLQVYLSRIHSNMNEISADTNFFLKLFSVTGSKYKGDAHTDAFVFPAEFKDDAQKEAFKSGVRAVLRRNNSDIIEQNFRPYQLDHETKGGRFRLKLGPLQWTKRETINRLDIVPPIDDEGRYNAEDHRRTVIQGQINKIGGLDFYGFFGSILNYFYSFIHLGGNSRGDDPASNFMGSSKSLIVSTELETTPTRENNTLVKIQQTYAGWTLKKKKLLKLLEGISKKLHKFNPNGGLIDDDSFSQTKRVQAYNLAWNLSIYDEGIQKLLNVLNMNVYNTRAALNFLANAMGMKEYEKFCAEKHLPIAFVKGPISEEAFMNRENRVIESSNGQMTLITCTPPWMQAVFDLRSKLRKHPEVFSKDVHDENLAKEKIHWLNTAIMKLESEVELSELINMVGVDQCYFQVSVSGYRKGDERAQDETGSSTYFSNTVGSMNKDIRNGPLADIARTSTIMQHEITARYLSDGF